MKIFLIIATFFCLFACSKKKDDPLILPPNFAEMPDPNNPEQPSSTQREENIAKLKELLIKSEE